MAHVQDTYANTTAASSQTVTLNGVAKGNLLALAVFTGNGAPVLSVVDGRGNLWARDCSSNIAGALDVEWWVASGVVAGNTTVTVTLVSVSATDFTLQLSEWSGMATVNAMDEEAWNTGTSNAPALGASLTGYENGQLFLAACKTSVAVTSAPSGFTALTTGATGDSAVYYVDSGMSAHNPTWGLGSAPAWAVACISLVPVRATDPPVNATIANMPELSLEISVVSGPFTPVWRNITGYMTSLDSHLGRNHGLDRFESGEMTVSLDGRDGTFNPWNTSSQLYNGGQGALPMAPMKLTAAWLGITYPIAYGYLDENIPTLQDAMNVEAKLHAYDILEFLQNALLSNDNYAQLILAEASLKAYWRLGDQTNQYAVADATGGAPGALINGRGGSPAFGAAGAFLTDSDTALDLTNGTKAPNGGFRAGSPISGATSWSVEKWLQFLGGTNTPGTVTAITGDLNTSTSITNVSSTSALSVGDPISARGIPATTTITGLSPTTITISNSASITATGVDISVITILNQTLFSTTTTGGEFDIQVGYYESGVGSLAVSVYAAIVCTLAGSIVLFSPQTAILDGKVHHLVATIANAGSTDTLTVYLDGVSIAVFGIGANGLENPTGTIVGCNAGALHGFAGIIDEVALYNSALSGSDVLAHYTIGTWLQEADIGMGTSGTASGRINKILAVAGVPPGVGVAAQAFLTPIYGETSSVTTTSALTYLQRISETEPGPIFQGPDGLVYGLSRQYVIGQGAAVGIMNPARAATSQGIFGDTSAATYRFLPKDFQLLRDKQDLYNDVQAQSGRTGTPAPVLQEFGPLQDSRLAQSTANFGRRVYQGLTQLLWLNDSDALLVAEEAALRYASGIQERVQFSIQSTDAANVVQMLSRQIYDRITVEYQGFTPGSQYTNDLLIERIEHNIVWDQTGPTWTTTYVCSPFEIHYASGVSGGEVTVSPVVPIILGTYKFGDTAQLTL